jgi:hypothetical protein
LIFRFQRQKRSASRTPETGAGFAGAKLKMTINKRVQRIQSLYE